MTFTTAVITAVLWLLGAAILGGLIIYFLMRSRLLVLKSDHARLLQKNKKLEADLESIKKELSLETSAYQRKLEITDGKYLTLQTECQEAQNALKAELEEKNKLIATLKSTPESAIISTGTDEKEDKKLKELEKIKEKAKSFDYSNIGIASAEQRDDLKLISGIGPFIEEKLNALGIYTFLQISKFTASDVEQVTKAIEFFPGRIERDEWIAQAKERIQ